MIRDLHLHRAQAMGDPAGQSDIFPPGDGEGAVHALLLYDQPCAVHPQQRPDDPRPIAFAIDATQQVPVVVQRDDFDGFRSGHRQRMRPKSWASTPCCVRSGAATAAFDPKWRKRIVARAPCCGGGHSLKSIRHSCPGRGYDLGVGLQVDHPEYQFLRLLERVLDKGDERLDRTGVGTKSLFGELLRFDLSGGQVPIITTKRVYWKTAVKEMLWFLTGGTNIRDLLDQNVRIWSDWPLARYRQATGEDISQSDFEARIVSDDEFASQWGELGPVYGKQWRRWVDAQGREHDQIATLVETLRSNPASRRMLFHAWNVSDLDQMALPPCHMVYQYHVNSRGELNCLLFQRSCDLFLGAAFNYVGASTLLLMLAQQAGLKPGELVWVGGDVHVYLNHADQVREQISRQPRPFPTMRLTRHPASIDDYRIEDFEVVGYEPHPAIHGDVAV